MSTSTPTEALWAMRKAAGDAHLAACARRRELFFACAPRDEYLEWSWIAQACRRELKRLNSLIARRQRAQAVAA